MDGWCTFSFTGNINCKNCVQLGGLWWIMDYILVDYLLTVTLTHLHESKVPVWCSFANVFVLGPYFFGEVISTGLKTCSITNARYTTVLQSYAIPELQQQNVLIDIAWMQGSVRPHGATPVRQVLQQYFDDRIISSIFAVSRSSLTSYQRISNSGIICNQMCRYQVQQIRQSWKMP